MADNSHTGKDDRRADGAPGESAAGELSEFGNETLALESVPWNEAMAGVMPFAAPMDGSNMRPATSADGRPFAGGTPPAADHSPWAQPQTPAGHAAHPAPAYVAATPAPPAIRPPDPLRDAYVVPGTSGVTSEPGTGVEAGLAPPSVKILSEEMLQLIWFTAEAVPRMRRQPAWRRILDEFEDHPHDPEVDDIVLDDDAMEVEDHRDTFELLSRAGTHTTARLNELLLQGVREGGKFVPPIALFAGELCFPFDPLEALKATISAALPFASADETLDAAIANANTFLETPHLISAPEVAGSLIKRITDAFRRVDRLVSKSYLEDQSSRALLENRHYQRRDIFGDEHIRALLRPSLKSREAVPTYLPATLAKELPMFEYFRVRLIATVEPAASQFESHPAALRAVAFGRVSRRPI